MPDILLCDPSCLFVVSFICVNRSQIFLMGLNMQKYAFSLYACVCGSCFLFLIYMLKALLIF